MRRRIGGVRAATTAILVVLGGAAIIAACGGDDATSTTTSADGCPKVEAPAPKQLDLATPTQKAPTATGVEFETSCGNFTVSFDDRSPRTAASFQYLAEEGAYDDTVFHRVVPDQLIQGGDPLGTDPVKAGSGGPGYFVDEPPPGSLSYTEGTVAMAKTAAEPIGRSGSQFLVVVSADLGLTPDYALVGEVTEGFDVVKAISELGEPGADGPPTTPVVIEAATPVGN